jgi:hypothetical protein
VALSSATSETAGTGASSFRARVAASTGGTIEVRVDGCNQFTANPGVLAGSCPVPSTGGSESWTDVQCPVSVGAGVHDLCLAFAGPDGVQLLELDYFTFE